MEWVIQLFSGETFMPHGHCYVWTRGLLQVMVASDALIALAYYSIPLALVAIVLKRRDVPFHWMFLMFGAFIVACGTTHLMEIWTTWVPVYWLEAWVKAATAVVSIATAILLMPVIPQVVAMPSLQGAVEELTQRKAQLMQTNEELQRFNQTTVQREERVIELKREVNELARAAGRTPPYHITEATHDA